MTLFRNFAVLRQHKGTPFAPIQILTGDIREGCHARHSRLHDVGRSLPPKSRIERRFESLPGVQRFANLWGTFGSFRTSEKNKPVLPRREIRGSANLDSARRNGGFAETKLKPSKKENRGSENLESAHKTSTSHEQNEILCRFAASFGFAESLIKPA